MANVDCAEEVRLSGYFSLITKRRDIICLNDYNEQIFKKTFAQGFFIYLWANFESNGGIINQNIDASMSVFDEFSESAYAFNLSYIQLMKENFSIGDWIWIFQLFNGFQTKCFVSSF